MYCKQGIGTIMENKIETIRARTESYELEKGRETQFDLVDIPEQQEVYGFYPLDRMRLHPGELYLFCAPETGGRLWGVYAHENLHGELLLETASYDQQHYLYWRTIPKVYRLVRAARREELRDYFYNLAYHEAKYKK